MLIITEPKVLYAYANNMSKVKFEEQVVVYNISANANQFPSLQIMPPMELLSKVGKAEEFDMEYMNYLIMNDQIFVQFMNIVNALSFGKDVILLVYREESTFDPITEVVTKLIQQRYGYNYVILDDLGYLDSLQQSSFTTEGLLHYEQDAKRYWDIVVRLNPQVFANETIHDEHL